MASQEEQAKLDAALDAALAEFDSDDDEDNDERLDHSPMKTQAKAATSESPSAGGSRHVAAKPRSTPPVAMGPPRPPDAASVPVAVQEGWSPEQLFANMMQQMIEGEGGASSSAEDELLGRLMQEMQTQLQSELISQMEAPAAVAATSGTKAKKQVMSAPIRAKQIDSAAAAKRAGSSCTKASTSAEKEEVEAAISDLVEGLAKQATMDDNEVEEDEVGSASESDNNDMLNSLMEGLASGISGGGDGGDFNPDAVIDGMMEQLLSKDLMYDPMKQVATKFPGWLEERRNTLSAEEYIERRKQCDCFCKLVQVYETEPNDMEKLMELMQEVQEYGQPPVEIIREIAPGIELDVDGMPKLDGCGLPFGGTEECRIT